MRDHFDLGSSPPMERCAQVGSPGYWEEARLECRLYIELLRRTVGPEPEGAELSVRRNLHDFGTYLSVVCSFDPSIEGAVAYALRCEGKGPDEWDDIARNKLREERRPHELD